MLFAVYLIMGALLVLAIICKVDKSRMLVTIVGVTQSVNR